MANQDANAKAPDPEPSLSTKTSVVADVLTPGQQEIICSGLLKPGTYDLECWVADDETGVPHFFMGMHKIIVVK